MEPGSWRRRIGGCLLAAWATVLPAAAQVRSDGGAGSALGATVQGAPRAASPAATSRIGNDRVSWSPVLVDTQRSPGARATSTRGAGARQAAKSLRLGIVRVANTRIYRRASKRSQVLFSCPVGTALALIGQTKHFFAVIMVDRSLGFIAKRGVELQNTIFASLDPLASQASQRIIQVALEFMGVPYVWGGNTRGGIDCSGFVRAVFHRLGVELPRVAREQYHVGYPVRWGELAPGDRLYFSTHGMAIDHTGIYLGAGRFIHASGAHGAVVVSSVMEPKYMRTLVGARRSI